jgi:hypothetical protein
LIAGSGRDNPNIREVRTLGRSQRFSPSGRQENWMLSAQRIIAEAENQVGIADPETHLHVHLVALVDALNGDQRLSSSGEASAHRNVLSRTVDRLSGIKWVLDYPEIAREQIVAPVFLTGLPRSGTTYFQFLFDRDRRFRLIRTWEAMMPSPPPGVKSRATLTPPSYRPTH